METKIKKDRHWVNEALAKKIYQTIDFARETFDNYPAMLGRLAPDEIETSVRLFEAFANCRNQNFLADLLNVSQNLSQNQAILNIQQIENTFGIYGCQNNNIFMYLPVTVCAKLAARKLFLNEDRDTSKFVSQRGYVYYLSSNLLEAKFLKFSQRFSDDPTSLFYFDNNPADYLHMGLRGYFYNDPFTVQFPPMLTGELT